MRRPLPCLLAWVPAAAALLHMPPASLDLAAPRVDSGQCSTLTNVDGTHFVISVSAGVPPQKFSLIPDTGSPWVILADTNCSVCRCGRHGVNKCFREEFSATLAVPPGATGGPQSEVLSFGSGPITVVVASDIVRLEGTHIDHFMESGVLLMVDNALSFTGPFEGLLGLGLPQYKLETSAAYAHTNRSYRDGFLDRAGVTNYTICLNDKGGGGSGGVLRFGELGGDDAYGITQNTMHWQLAFHGVTLGTSTKPLGFCTASDTSAGQKSPCAAIIDSGTTYILGPLQQVHILFSGLCDEWERCRTKHAEMSSAVKRVNDAWRKENASQPRSIREMTKSDVFQILLNDCHSWISHGDGLEEMPKLNFQIRGRSGKEGALQLHPWDYIISREEYGLEVVYEEAFGIKYANGVSRKAHKVWACTPAFASMDFPTASNGQAWIFGLPIFYSYAVSYIADSIPPSVSFRREEAGCGSCARKSHRALPRWKKPSLQRPRKMHGDPLLPTNAQRVRLALLE